MKERLTDAAAILAGGAILATLLAGAAALWVNVFHMIAGQC